MKKHVLLATSLLLGMGLVPLAQARQSSESRDVGDRIEYGAKRTGDTIQHGAEWTGRTVRSGAVATGRAVQYGARRTGDAAEAVAERTRDTGESAMDRIGSPFRAMGRTLYHLVSPQADLDVPWNEDQGQGRSSRTREYRD